MSIFLLHRAARHKEAECERGMVEQVLGAGIFAGSWFLRCQSSAAGFLHAARRPAYGAAAAVCHRCLAAARGDALFV